MGQEVSWPAAFDVLLGATLVWADDRLTGNNRHNSAIHLSNSSTMAST